MSGHDAEEKRLSSGDACHGVVEQERGWRISQLWLDTSEEAKVIEKNEDLINREEALDS